MLNDIDEKLFEQIFGHKLIKLVEKLINTTDKEENQIIVKNIEKNKDKIFEMKDYSNEWVIQPNSQCINLIDTIKLILKFIEDSIMKMKMRMKIMKMRMKIMKMKMKMKMMMKQ